LKVFRYAVHLFIPIASLWICTDWLIIYVHKSA